MNCKKCREQLAETDLFCTNCGFSTNKKSKSKKINFFRFFKKIDLSNLKKFIFENWFKLSFILCFIILIIVGFFIFKNAQERNNQLEDDKINYQKQTDCRDIVSKIEADFKKEDSLYISFWEFKYNKNTQRCILAYTISNGYSSFFEMDLGLDYLVKDVFTGEKFFESKSTPRGDKSVEANKNLKEKMNFYFNEK